MEAKEGIPLEAIVQLDHFRHGVAVDLAKETRVGGDFFGDDGTCRPIYTCLSLH